MKILLANYRYFISGGPERYLFNIQEAFNKLEHITIPLSVKYKKNLQNSYSEYFIDPIGSEEQVYFKDHTFRLKTLYKTFTRLFYDFSVKKKVSLLAKKTKPEVAYILHYLRKFSPSLLIAIKSEKIPIVVRISDFAMLCPQAHCFRNCKPCQLCVSGNLWPSIRWKCVQNSLFASALNAIATIFHRKIKFFELVDCFVVTNPFMYQLMINAGYPPNRLKLIPTFVDTSFFKPKDHFLSNVYTFIYSGRLEYIKGVHVILEALGKLKYKRPNLPWQLKIAGSGDHGYLNFLKTICSKYKINNSVSFMGQLCKKELAAALSSAQIGIIPSLWYENLPNSLLEYFASGLPVISSDIGSLPYCVENNKNGILFPSGNTGKLTEALLYCIDNPKIVSAMSQQARKTAQEKYSKDEHVSTLLTLFFELIDQRKF